MIPVPNRPLLGLLAIRSIAVRTSSAPAAHASGALSTAGLRASLLTESKHSLQRVVRVLLVTLIATVVRLDDFFNDDSGHSELLHHFVPQIIELGVHHRDLPINRLRG